MLKQLVKGQIQEIARALGLHKHLLGVAVHVAHRVNIDTIARDLRSLFILFKHFAESFCIASCGLNHTSLVGFGLLIKTRSHTSRYRHHGIGVRLTFIDLTFAILPRLNGVIEGSLHLLRGLSVLYGNAHYLNSRLITVQHRLHGHLNGRRNFLLAFKKHRVHGLAANHFTHSRFGGVKHAAVRVATAEKIILGGMRLDAVLHVEHDVNDVFVVGEHQSFLQTLRRTAHADFGFTHTRNIDNFDILHRPRQTPVDARRAVLGVLAKRRHHADLAFGNDVDAAGKPSNGSHTDQSGNTSYRKRFRIRGGGGV